MRYDSVWFRRPSYGHDIRYDLSFKETNEEGFTRIDTGSLYHFWTRHSVPLEYIGEIVRLGRDDFTVSIMASSESFPRLMEKCHFTFAYLWIKSFELIQVTDLPLYMGLKVYPPMEAILKGQK